MRNPVVYFEIPVTDMQRAKQFYSSVFTWSFQEETIDNNEMALFPFVDSLSGITGALAKGDSYVPSQQGVVVYFHTESIQETLRLVVEHGGSEFYPKTSVGELGFVAECIDTEGNRIALHQALD